ncbi:hypothetical protein OG921_24485, partial [Aldersonia sp. NBC_00410]|nr:hypothetical protein [Aldersonia sp. NBC_00410]
VARGALSTPGAAPAAAPTVATPTTGSTQTGPWTSATSAGSPAPTPPAAATEETKRKGGVARKGVLVGAAVVVAAALIGGGVVAAKSLTGNDSDTTTVAAAGPTSKAAAADSASSSTSTTAASPSTKNFGTPQVDADEEAAIKAVMPTGLVDSIKDGTCQPMTNPGGTTYMQQCQIKPSSPVGKAIGLEGDDYQSFMSNVDPAQAKSDARRMMKNDNPKNVRVSPDKNVYVSLDSDTATPGKNYRSVQVVNLKTGLIVSYYANTVQKTPEDMQKEVDAFLRESGLAP